MSPGYVPAIDGLRAIAVLAVLVFHLDRAHLPGGLAGVDVFFVISGFVVTAAMAVRPFRGGGDLFAAFYARRMVRIVPALVVCLVATFLLIAWFVPLERLDNHYVGLAAFAGVSNIALILLPSDYFDPAAELDPFLHTWSLGIEEQFYLVFPLLLWLLHRDRRRGGFPVDSLRIVTGASALSLLLYILLERNHPKLAFYLMPARFWELGAGMALYLAAPVWLPRLRALPRAPAEALWWLALLALGWFFLRLPASHFSIPALVIPAGATLLLIGLSWASPGTLPARLLASRLPVAIGLASYSLYLWHWPILALARWTYGLDTPVKIVATLLLILAATWLSYRFVEQPVRGAFRSGRISRRRVLLAGPAALLLGAAAAYGLLRLQPYVSMALPVSRLAFALPSGCRAEFTSRSFHQGIADEWRPCRPRAPRLFVIGDSHARSYGPILDLYASDAGGPVIRYSRQQCTFPPIWTYGEAIGGCLDFDEAAVADIARQARPGDIVFAASRRLREVAERAPTPEERLAGEHASMLLLTRLAGTGARIVLEAPKPTFASPAFRCLAWFNRINPVCRPGLAMSRPALLARRAAELRDLARLAAAIPGARLWDPFPVLCPSDPCRPLRNGKLLFSDDNHLSGAGNLLLWPSFRVMMTGPAAIPPALPPAAPSGEPGAARGRTGPPVRATSPKAPSR